MRRDQFPSTQWSLVLIAGEGFSQKSQDALAELCRAYWYPLYAFVRRQGHDPTEAQDLTQAFFTRLLEKKYLRDCDRDRGRFRSFLLASLKHFLSNERDRARAQKRGGGASFFLWTASFRRVKGAIASNPVRSSHLKKCSNDNEPLPLSIE